ncbi:MAG: DegV family protein [Acidimicrobiales bacterium]
MPVRIVTDSSCDLDAAETDELGIEVVPLSIRIGSTEYTDRVDLSVEDFYTKMAASPTLPETAAPSPGAFETAFRRQAEAGADAVLCVTLSSGLSATMQAAQSAATALAGDLDVRVVDSRSITMGLGTIALVAAQAAADGDGMDAVATTVDDLVARTHVVGTLDTLENVRKGGRIGKGQAFLGSLLSIKPLVDLSTGVLEPAGKARTRRKALDWVRDVVMELPKVEHLAVIHSMAPDLDDLLDMLSPRYERDAVRIATIGPVVGTHGGPAMIGATWLDPV